ncbi:choice-of-anchor L domain-containing protein [Sulfurimonas paralvinellae]|uniref:Fibronectin type-III domain-containing protein n=1 Tax=Sulfurimonas paralvinellae TaxID=317658 RepID=A0A7M1B9E6_9BACT|nr:choice-of-anchor L domain-containing protein [Sulfurimonas paralvinellae]QOP46347.1 hypothetical protein FM071_08615 [Sulfurimonas paralvinellae]
MKSFSKKTIFLLLLIIIPTSSIAATACTGTTATCSYDITAAELASQIEGSGITITNPVITHGSGSQVGIFSNGINGSNLEIDEGITLTCMSVEESFTTNSSWSTSITASDTYTDADLTGIDDKAIYNPVIFEFDVTLDENTRLLLIDYQFASEEYNEYVGSQYNDAFGFFISGGDLNQTYNIARVVDNQTYVTINDINNYDTVTLNNVNNGTAGQYGTQANVNTANTAYYIDNDQNNQGGTSPVLVEYDGLTHTLHATLDNLTPGETYHFKMAIADTADAYWDTGVFINKIRGLRAPKLCYDYAYKQNERYITAEYNDSVGPYIDTDVSTSEPLEIAMYFKNQEESDLAVSNVKLNVLDINTSQAAYSSESVYVTQPGSVYPEHIADNTLGMTTTNSEILNIPIDSFDSFENFYTYFSINPQTSHLTMPIVARLDYNITIPLSATQSVTLPRSSLIDQDIPICGGGASSYKPAYGLFNIIENGLNPGKSAGDNNLFYNLNTQVVNRTPNISVVSMDENNLDTLKDINGSVIVAVDMVDLGAFHDTVASCNEESNAISKRVWTTIDNAAQAAVSLLPGEARVNATFRVSYNADGNNTGALHLIPAATDGSGNVISWNVANFPSLAGNNCLQDMDGNPNNVDTVPSWCNNAGTAAASAMDFDELVACQQCIYGYDTKFICSRDNFAVRPEAFHIQIKDQNQTVTTANEPLIGTNTSTSPLKLAAGYNYILEINATNHLDNNASRGYYTGIDTAYIWSPPVGKDISGCNDDNNYTANINFGNGIADQNTSLNQVGAYSFNISDTKWTAVDSDLNYLMDTNRTNHYLAPYSAHFLTGTDCVLNSDFVDQSAVNDNLTGCDINSTHSTHISSTQTITYNDLNISFYPYKFDINGSVTGNPILPTVGINYQAVAPIHAFVYMSDINNSADENMSYHLNGFISAAGYNDVLVGNFVEKCYATPLTITIKTTNRDLNDTEGNHVTFRARFHDVNKTTTKPITNLDVNVSDTAPNVAEFQFDTNESHFYKTSNGSIRTYLNLNYDRNVTKTVNPKAIIFLSYDVNDTNISHAFHADLLNNKTSEMKKDLNTTLPIKFYYGRAHAGKQRFEVPTDNPYTTNIYYEIYCYNAGCNLALIPSIQHVDDIRWYQNTLHVTTNDGNVSSPLTEQGAFNVTSSIPANGTNTTTANLNYNGALGYPYTTTMEINASNWLIYNENDANAQTNPFQVEFNNANSSWSGERETTTTTKASNVSKTNRRTMW